MTLHILDSKFPEEKLHKWEESLDVIAWWEDPEIKQLNIDIENSTQLLLIRTSGESEPKLFDHLMNAMNAWDKQSIQEVVMGATQRYHVFTITKEMVIEVKKAYDKPFTEWDFTPRDEVLEFMINNINQKAVIISW